MPRKPLLLFALLAASLFAQNTAAPRVYELRTYHCFDGRLDALKARFRDHTIEIFKRHGIESVAYWTPQDPEIAKNTLVYLISHANREAAKANWAAFMSDPEWRKVSADSEKDGKIVQKVDSLFLDPTDFSPLK
jgi:NIPSNAP